MRSALVSTSRCATRGGRFSGVDRWPVLGVHRGERRREASFLLYAIALETMMSPTTEGQSVGQRLRLRVAHAARRLDFASGSQKDRKDRAEGCQRLGMSRLVAEGETS